MNDMLMKIIASMYIIVILCFCCTVNMDLQRSKVLPDSLFVELATIRQRLFGFIIV